VGGIRKEPETPWQPDDDENLNGLLGAGQCFQGSRDFSTMTVQEPHGIENELNQCPGKCLSRPRSAEGLINYGSLALRV
jgi:IS30 family transposase